MATVLEFTSPAAEFPLGTVFEILSEVTSGTHRFEYDRETSDVTMAVVGALSAVTKRDDRLLAPLQEFVETDAFDAVQ